jgi:hypothetical protein
MIDRRVWMLLLACCLAAGGAVAMEPATSEEGAASEEAMVAEEGAPSEEAGEQPGGEAEEDQSKEPSIEGNLAIAEAVKDSLAQVEYTLRFDKGDPPGGGRYGSGLATYVTEERPYEQAAYVLSPTQVITYDPLIHSRFLKGIAVRFGEQVVGAEVERYALGERGMILKLAKPLKGARPLEFDPGKEGPYTAVMYRRVDAEWTIRVASFPTNVGVSRSGRKFFSSPSSCLVVDGEGVPVAVSMLDELPADGTWKGSPLKWPAISAADLAARTKKLEEAFAKGVMRVKLSFRSPKKTSGYGYSSYGDEGKTERNVLGGLIDERRVVVLVSLKPKVTARLERIMVHPPTGKPVPAKFACTLEDYGAFIATLDEPMAGALKLFGGKILDQRYKLLLTASVKIEGEKLTTYYWHNRISSFAIGWKQKVYPGLPGRDEGELLFDRDLRLVAFPIARREKESVASRWSSDYARLTPAAHLAELLPDLAKNSDPSNVPLTEEEENRLAWLGVELQPLNQELARINKVSQLTDNGRIGAIVSYVYPDSPAAKAKIQAADVLIRLHVEDHPKPIDIRIQDYGFSSRPFPWDRLDEVSERYYENIPRPWPPAENTVTRTLTDLGMGKKFELEFCRGGKAQRKTFTIAEGPAHYDSAKRYKSEALGLTVRNLTYEVRRYFHKTPDDPGVIVSKIEPGSKASVSGIKPYEIITHVSERPVTNVEQFEKAIAGQEELRLAVKRMTKGRVVKIRMEAPTTRPASGKD